MRTARMFNVITIKLTYYISVNA